MCQQMICERTNYFHVGSEKGHFHKKLFFTVNQTRMFYSLKEWTQPVPKSKLCSSATTAYDSQKPEGLNQQKTIPAGAIFSSRFFLSPLFCMGYCDCWTDVTRKCATNNVVFGFDRGFTQRVFAEASRALTDSTHCLKTLGWLTGRLLWVFL